MFELSDWILELESWLISSSLASSKLDTLESVKSEETESDTKFTSKLEEYKSELSFKIESVGSSALTVPNPKTRKTNITEMPKAIILLFIINSPPSNFLKFIKLITVTQINIISKDIWLILLNKNFNP